MDLDRTMAVGIRPRRTTVVGTMVAQTTAARTAVALTTVAGIMARPAALPVAPLPVAPRPVAPRPAARRATSPTADGTARTRARARRLARHRPHRMAERGTAARPRQTAASAVRRLAACKAPTTQWRRGRPVASVVLEAGAAKHPCPTAVSCRPWVYARGFFCTLVRPHPNPPPRITCAREGAVEIPSPCNQGGRACSECERPEDGVVVKTAICFSESPSETDRRSRETPAAVHRSDNDRARASSRFPPAAVRAGCPSASARARCCSRRRVCR